MNLILVVVETLQLYLLVLVYSLCSIQNYCHKILKFLKKHGATDPFAPPSLRCCFGPLLNWDLFLEGTREQLLINLKDKVKLVQISHLAFIINMQTRVDLKLGKGKGIIAVLSSQSYLSSKFYKQWDDFNCKQILVLLAWKGVRKWEIFPYATFWNTFLLHYF